MPQKRHKTQYPGVFYRERTDARGKPVKVYFIIYYHPKTGEHIEEKVVGPKMTPAKANTIRALKAKGAKPTRREEREARKAKSKAAREQWTLQKLWDTYVEMTARKDKGADKSRFEKYIKPEFGELDPADITTWQMKKLRASLEKQKFAPQTVKHVLALFRRLIRFGVRNGFFKDPGIHFEMPALDNEKVETLTPAQLKKLKDVLAEWPDCQAAGLVQLALHTGMRRSEMLRLKWNDIDEDGGFVYIRSPKGGKSHTIPLSNQARKILTNHPKEGDYVFTTQKGGRQRKCFNRALRELKEKAELPADFRILHGLRHHFASTMASNGVDLYTIQRLLGHSSPAMTQRYSHLADAALRDAAQVGAMAIEAQAKEAEESAE